MNGGTTMKKQLTNNEYKMFTQGECLQTIANLKAENERLNKNIDSMVREHERLIKVAKIEGGKEFADKLDTYIIWHFPIDDLFIKSIRSKLDNLLKELVGEDK